MHASYKTGEGLRIRILQMKRLVRILQIAGYGATIVKRVNENWGTDWGIVSDCSKQIFDKYAEIVGLHRAPFHDSEYKGP